MRDLREVLQTFDEPIDLDLPDDDIVIEVVVLLRTQRLDSTDDALIIGANLGLGGVAQYGLMCAARTQVEHSWLIEQLED